MEPFTASNIKARPKNVVKDFVHVAGLLKVNYFIVISNEKVPILFTKTLDTGRLI